MKNIAVLRSEFSQKAVSGMGTAALVVALVLAVAAVSIPNLLRSRLAVSTPVDKAAYMLQEEASAPGVARQAALAGGRQVLYTGTLALVVADPAVSLEEVRRIAVRLGGYVESASQSDSRSAWQSASVTVRVPATRYDEARREIRGLAERVENESYDARDVTAQAVDLEASLKNFRAEEAQYLEIMQRAGPIEDTLAVAERLSDVRGRIERSDAQRKHLAGQVEMASIQVTLRLEPVPQAAEVRWQPLATIRAAFWDAARDLAAYTSFMIAVLFRLPVMLLWVVTALVFAAAGLRLLRLLWRLLFPRPAAA